WLKYQSEKKKQLDVNYQNIFLNDASLNLGNTIFQNYRVDGAAKYLLNRDGQHDYAEIRLTQKPINGKIYSTPDFYPASPLKWRSTQGPRHSWEWFNYSRDAELDAGDDLYSPFVCAGYNTNEENVMRPGQFLGLLKSIGMLGVDFYNAGYFNEGLDLVPPQGVDEFINPKGWVWQATSSPYAQAIISRGEEFIKNGSLMRGDVPIDLTNPSGTKGFNFACGNPNALIIARQLTGFDKYFICGALQTLSNEEADPATGIVPQSKLVQEIQFNITPTVKVKMQARKQGSVYIFDNTNAANPIFYQIDKWHDWTHPEYWTKDFDFEAEVFDNNTNTPTIATIDNTSNAPVVVNGNGVLDFTNSTSFASFTSAAQVVEYNFQPRTDGIANDYNLWIRARSKTGSSTGFGISVNSTANNFHQKNNISCITNTTWQWYRLDGCSSATISYAGLVDDGTYTLKIIADNSELQIDRIYLDAPDIVSFNPSYVLTACGLPVVNYSGNQATVINQTGKRINISANTTFNANATFTNCNIVVATGATLSVGTGATLDISGSSIYSCNDMWQGIVNNGGSVNISNSSVNDAVLAAKGMNGSVMNIHNNSFDNNRTSLWFENGNFSTSFVYGNSFDNTGAQLTKAPYIGQDSPYHINILNVSNILIGKVSAVVTDKNIFHNALIGINSATSNVTVKNNVFNNIGGNNFQNREKYPPPPNYTIPNSAILSAGDQNTMYSLTVGGILPNEPNNFNTCETGIFAHKAQNVSIKNNTLDLCPDGIRLQTINKRNVDVNGNILNHYQYGISFIDVYNNTASNVLNNHLNDGLGYSAQQQGVTGIEVQYTYSNSDLLTISNNVIENTQNAIQLRNVGGCLVCNMAYLKIAIVSNNTIRQVIPAVDLQNNGNVHYGIWGENCYQLNAINNTISWNSTPSPQDLALMRGISISYDRKCIIQGNNIIKMGAGIRAFEDNQRTSLLCNTFNQCIHGVYLDPAGINNKLSDQGDKVYNGSFLDLANSKSWKNKWINNIDPNRVAGTLAPLYQFDWLYTTTIPEYSPINNVIGMFPKIVGQETTICNPPLMDDKDRDEEFARVIHDTIIPDPDSSDFKYLDKEAFFLLAKQYPQLLNMGVPSDALYQQKYNDIAQTNIGKLAEARAAMENDDNTTALLKLYSLANQNQQEDNMKQTLTLNMQGFSSNPTPAATAILTLDEIAHQHPFYGGVAVYYARAMLRKNVEDVLPQMRKAYQQNQPALSNQIKSAIKLNPNPANGYVTILSAQPFADKCILVIENTLGNKVAQYNIAANSISYSFNTFYLINGIYTCKIISGNEIIGTQRLVIIK
ncbi:MAG TPA: right-handed parallel beta-helix repeat-containing protein, partial [Bacteroidia bacterium]|nr:right-handed parallel beta-helix repeat-containing protein [Bacteroidia bacterium]